MLKVAFIPHSEIYFEPNYDLKEDRWPFIYYMQEVLKKHDCEFKTISAYKNWEEVDLFIFFNSYDLHYPIYLKLMRMNLLSRCAYWMLEPATVMWWNDKKYVKDIKKFFPVIATWNSELFSYGCLRLDLPLLYDKEIHTSSIPYSNKKLLVNISGNKFSDNPNELYSERIRIIQWFQEHHPEDFGLYGGLLGGTWNGYICYKGSCEDKTQVYHDYKFALCLENEKSGNTSYMTEKIFDCIRAGIVPIYQGADNIKEMIPFRCYIDYREFSDILQLYNFLENMTEEEYNKYLDEASKFMQSKYTEPWEPEQAFQNIAEIVSKLDKEWKINLRNRCFVYYTYAKYLTRNKILELYSKSKILKKIWRTIKVVIGLNHS